MMDGLIRFGESVLPHLRDSVMQVSALIAAFFVMARLFRRRSLTSRYWLWVYCLVGILILPGLSFLVRDHSLALLPARENVVVARPVVEPASPVSHVVDSTPMAEVADTVFPSEETRTAATAEEHSEEPPSSEIAVPKGVVAASTTDSGQPTQPTVSAPIRGTASPFPWRGWIALAWVVGCGAFLLRLVLATGCIARIRRSARAVDDPSVCQLFEQVKRESGATDRVRLRIGKRVSAPVSIGISRSTILLPESLIREMPPEQLRPILLHELAHVRWNDYAVNLLQRLTEAILFFHPFVHLMNRHLRRMREEMCDNWVLSRSPKATVYARALTALAEKCLTPRKSLVGVGLFQHPARLRQRIERILACGSPLSVRFRFGTAMALLTFSILAVGGLSLTTLSARAVPAEERKPAGAVSEPVPGEHAAESRLTQPGEMKDVTESTEIVIDATKDGKYLVDRVERPIEEIEDMLKRIAELHPKASIILRGERETPYRDIVRVLDACKTTGLRNISFAVKPREKESDREIEAATIDFLEAQVKQYQDKVRASSEALAKFKAAHGLELGELSAVAELTMRGLRDELAAAERELSSAKAARGEIEKKLAELEPTVVIETVVEANPLMSQYRARLSDLELQLSRMRQKYADRHPQVIKTKDEIESLKALIETTEEKVTTKETHRSVPQYDYLRSKLKVAERRMKLAQVERVQLMGKLWECWEPEKKTPLQEKAVRLTEEDALNRKLLDYYTKELQKARIEAEKEGEVSVVVAIGTATPGGSEEVFVYVEGEVNNPGVYTFTGKGQPTLYRAIIMAGGFADYANQRKVVLIRADDGGKRTRTEVDVSETIKNPELDPVVQSDDIIHVPRTSVF